ncbi:hypothetical protein LSG31_23045 [Fodinisporobacter ferrooxydans]|uniref:Uncharacterized protein n=1 Tax=Fodinisporobacter ferrooxydans TaxID=2901836 RepID=A0ABY4CJK2_9BACL|nr:hypothetical protein LSG31_23045 [Alicyclobacillaceae bacterium MYW30-H2]
MKLTKLTAACVLICFLTYQPVYANELAKIEVFDASKGTVVRTIQNTQEIQDELSKVLRQVHTVYPKAKIEFTDKEIVYKIPIQPPIVKEDTVLLEAFIMKMPANETILICFDNKDRSFIYRFDHVLPLVDKLSKAY